MRACRRRAGDRRSAGSSCRRGAGRSLWVLGLRSLGPWARSCLARGRSSGSEGPGLAPLMIRPRLCSSAVLSSVVCWEQTWCPCLRSAALCRPTADSESHPEDHEQDEQGASGRSTNNDADDRLVLHKAEHGHLALSKKCSVRCLLSRDKGIPLCRALGAMSVH
jgi:hypothetical protein